MKVLKLGAKNCSGCKIMGPRWKDIEAENTWIDTEYIETDGHPEIIEKYNLKTIPTFIFLNKEGKEITRLSGVVEKEVLLNTAEENKEK